MSVPVLEVTSLRVTAGVQGREEDLVRGFDLRVERGEAVALVGESGSGKTMSMLSIMGLLPSGVCASFGELRLDGEDISTFPSAQRRALNGRRIALIPQDAMAAMNPTLALETQFTLMMRRHLGLTQARARLRAQELLDLVGIQDAKRRLRGYPHELSGGQRQRVMIALALCCDPDLLIADEPTTALDVTLQQQILDLVAQLRRERELAVVWITHDLGVVAGLADRVSVMRSGEIVETAAIDDLFSNPTHPYTRQLLAATPRIDEGRYSWQV